MLQAAKNLCAHRLPDNCILQVYGAKCNYPESQSMVGAFFLFNHGVKPWLLIIRETSVHMCSFVIRFGRCRFRRQVIIVLPPSTFQDPLPLDRCIVCCEPDWEDYFEIQEFVNKESFVFKVRNIEIDGEDEKHSSLHSLFILHFWAEISADFSAGFPADGYLMHITEFCDLNKICRHVSYLKAKWTAPTAVHE